MNEHQTKQIDKALCNLENLFCEFMQISKFETSFGRDARTLSHMFDKLNEKYTA